MKQADFERTIHPNLEAATDQGQYDERVSAVLSRSNGQLITCDEIFRLTADGEFYVSPASKSSIGEMFGVKPSGNIFKRNGQGDWTVAFGGDSMPVKHVSGLSYIAILLGSPGIDFRVQDLDERVTGVNSAHKARPIHFRRQRQFEKLRNGLKMPLMNCKPHSETKTLGQSKHASVKLTS